MGGTQQLAVYPSRLASPDLTWETSDQYTLGADISLFDGRLNQMTYEYTNYPTLKDNMLPCHEYYPIPDKEVVYSGGALDNKAYNEYGM